MAGVPPFLFLHLADAAEEAGMRMLDQVVLVFGEGDVLCDDFKHFVVEVLCDLEHAREVAAEFRDNELLCVVLFHFREDLCHHGCIDVARDLGEVLRRQVVGVAGRLLDTHLETDPGGDSGLDVLDHERDDDEVRDVLDNHADGLVQLVEPVGTGGDDLLRPGKHGFLLMAFHKTDGFGYGDTGPQGGVFDGCHVGDVVR